MEQLLGFREVASRLGLGATLTRELIYAGKIKSLKIGKRRLVRSAAVDDYVARLCTEQQEPVEA